MNNLPRTSHSNELPRRTAPVAASRSQPDASGVVGRCAAYGGPGIKIAVLVKQVPTSTDLGMNRSTGTLIRDNTGVQVNPFDLHALEEGLKIKEASQGTITIISLGPARAADSLRECLGYGADNAVLLTDKAFAGSDTLATSTILSRALKMLNTNPKYGPWDLILCGKQAIDGDTGQVGPGIAGLLDIPHITEVSHIDTMAVNNTENAPGHVHKIAIIKRFTQYGWSRVKVTLPALFSVSKDVNIPRLPSIQHIRTAESAPISIMNAVELGLDEPQVGLSGSPTRVSRIFRPETRKENSVIKGTPSQCAESIVAYMKKEGLL